jgi:hypothetical protein
MVAAMPGSSVFLTVICFAAVACWVADQTLSDVRKLSNDWRRRRRR